MKSIREVFNILILNINFLLKNKGKALANLSIVFFALLIPIFFVPLKASISLVFFLGAVIPSSIIYISTTFNWRRSTLNQNLKTNSSERSVLYIGSYLTMNIFAFIEVFLIIFLLWILQITGVLEYGWRGAEAPGRAYDILHINFAALFYSMFEAVLVMFATLFLIQNIINSEKAVYSFVVIVIILAILFGGVFNYSFSHTGWVDSDHYYKYNVYSENIFGEFLYYPIAFAFPLFGPMQHLSSLRFTANTMYNDSKILFFYFQNSLNISFWEALHWDILWFLPYVHTAIFATVAITIGKFTKEH